MNAGKVNGWWVVAAAAIPIAIDLATSPAWQADAFLALLVLLAPVVFLFWFISKDA